MPTPTPDMQAETHNVEESSQQPEHPQIQDTTMKNQPNGQPEKSPDEQDQMTSQQDPHLPNSRHADEEPLLEERTKITEEEEEDAAEPIDPKASLEPFAWEELEERFLREMEECRKAEEKLEGEFGEWCRYLKENTSTTKFSHRGLIMDETFSLSKSGKVK
ncbi:MAG: hypothetical protein Q9219_005367 [cf. Caloplaca sp. 3 TL-2023]